MIIDKIDVSKEHKHLSIREISDTGGYHRRSILCNETLADDEHQEVKAKAEEVWTDEVKASWATFQAEQQAETEAE